VEEGSIRARRYEGSNPSAPTRTARFLTKGVWEEGRERVVLLRRDERGKIMTTIQQQVIDAVALGVTRLDQYLGLHWDRTIDPLILDLECADTCILGQLFGYFYTPKSAEFLGTSGHMFASSSDPFTVTATRHGFCVSEHVFTIENNDYQAVYDLLEVEWRRVIQERHEQRSNDELQEERS
jgi:hypothetical protein